MLCVWPLSRADGIRKLQMLKCVHNLESLSILQFTPGLLLLKEIARIYWWWILRDNSVPKENRTWRGYRTSQGHEQIRAPDSQFNLAFTTPYCLA